MTQPPRPAPAELEEPAFLDDDGPSAEIPPFITTTNARELYGLREGETVAEAIARSHDALKADPSRVITVDQMRARLAVEHAKSGEDVNCNNA